MSQGPSGFSLIETMIALGLTGAVVMGVMFQTDVSNKIMNKSDMNQDLNIITAQIQRVLSKPENCTATINGDLSGIIQVYLRDGNRLEKKVFSKGEQLRPYIQKTVSSRTEIHIADIINEKGLCTAGDNCTGVLKVNFRFGRVDPNDSNRFLSLSHFKSNTFNKEFKYIIGPDGKCFTELAGEDEIDYYGKRLACESMNAFYDPDTKECNLRNLPACFLADLNQGGCGSSTVYTQQRVFKILRTDQTILRYAQCCRIALTPPVLPGPTSEFDDDGPDPTPDCDPTQLVAMGPDRAACPPAPAAPTACTLDADNNPVPANSSWSVYGSWSYCVNGKQYQTRVCGANCDCSAYGTATREQDCTVQALEE